MRRRSGFTLVELLVSMALIIFIMFILSQAFKSALGSFRSLKAIGDMDERLRSVTIVIRHDLTKDHFEGRRRLSDPGFWSMGPPREGFFRIWQGSAVSTAANAPYFREFTDALAGGGDAITSERATNHMLHFTIKLRGNERQDFLSARVPLNSPLVGYGQPDARYQDTTGTYRSQWAEVAYFLRPTGTRAGTTPLYALYRRELLAVPESRELNWGSAQVTVNNIDELRQYSEISCKKANPSLTAFPDQLYFNNATDLTVPQRRFGMDPTLNGGMPTVRPSATDTRTWTYPTLAEEDPARAGSDLLLTDVISFQVQMATTGNFVDIPVSTVNSNFNASATKPRVFDTWTNLVDDRYDYGPWNTGLPPGLTPAVHPKRIPQQPIIRVLKITLRVWDAKTQLARQISIVQEM